MYTVLRWLAVGTCAVSALACGDARAQDRWGWAIEPYVWGATLGTDLDVGAPPPGSVDTEFNGVLDQFDGFFELRAEGQGERFGVFGDFTYFGLSDEHALPRFNSESDLDVRLFEAAGVWNPAPGRYRGLDLFAGLRYIDLDLTVDLHPQNPTLPAAVVKESDTYADLMLGARYNFELAERWGLTLRGDGSFGQTDGTWGASAMLRYRTGNGAWLLGYRHLEGELGSRDDSTRLTVSGPEVGYAFRF